jgi:hypothetical protein
LEKLYEGKPVSDLGVDEVNKIKQDVCTGLNWLN